MLLLPEKKKLKYPNWLLITFAISSTSWIVSFGMMLFKMIIAIATWDLPGLNIIDLWFGLSNLAIFLCVWKASKYGR